MKLKKILKVALLVALFLITKEFVFADTTIHLDIETNTDSIYNKDINVAPCDSDNDPATPDTESAYCALVKSGITSDWSGLWVNSINGIVNNDNNNGVYWMWLVNLNINNATSSSCNQDNPYSCSAKQYILKPNDHILFYYNTNPLNISVNNLKPTVSDNITITITELGLDSSWSPVWKPSPGATATLGAQSCTTIADGTCSIILNTAGSFTAIGSKSLYVPSPSIGIEVSAPVTHSSGGSYVVINTITPPPVTKTQFDLKKAFDFIISQQKENGSFGEDLYTDWAAIALVSGNYQDQTTKLVKYFGKSKISDASLTDYERHAMALMALGLNPYNTNSENYIKKIIDSFDGKQFGDIKEDNDDIFALVVLQNAGYTKDEDIIKNTINFILSKQKENGSWDESIDLTGAAVESISAFTPIPGVRESLEKAKEFLKNNQKDTGGWNNVSATTWALEGILALGEKPADWTKNDNTPLNYLALNQDIDGGIKNTDLKSKLWETTYATSALSSKTWNQIMQKFEKPKEIATDINTKKTIVSAKPVTNQKITKKDIIIKNILTNPTITITDSKTEETPPVKKSWLKNIWDKFFSIF